MSFIVAAINILAYFFIKKYQDSVKLILLLINAFFAAFSTYIYIVAGKDKIQYGWAIVCIINLYVIVSTIRKKRDQNTTVKME